MKWCREYISIVIGMSSPSRGTWIEIGYQEAWAEYRYKSSPSRGTWIEILKCLDAPVSLEDVVPLAGDVD